MKRYSTTFSLWSLSVLLCLTATMCEMESQVINRCNTEVSLWKRNHSADDVDIRSYILSSLSKISSVVECARRCRNDCNCQSFSYNNDGTCRLHSRTMAMLSDDSTSPGWRHFYVDAGDQLNQVPGENKESFETNSKYDDSSEDE